MTSVLELVAQVAAAEHVQRPSTQPNDHAPTRPNARVGSSLSMARMVALLDELDTGVLVCQASGEVLLANDAARRELARKAPLAIDAQGQLITGHRSNTLALHAALHAAVHRQRRQLLPLTSASERLLAMVSPMESGGTGSGSGACDCALVLLGRRQITADLTVQMLASLYRLTSAECRVLSGLLAGKPVVELAQMHGVKLSTTRTQVAALRQKLGLRRTNDLALMAATLPPIASALRCPDLNAVGWA